MTARDLFVGLMSGTSLDGVDAALVEFASDRPVVIDTAYMPLPGPLRAELHALQITGSNELDRAARAGNALTRLYAEVVLALLERAGIAPAATRAIGCHGQTIRHRPDAGYTLQICNPALLAELAGVSVVADFRSRDIAAGGQGAPLVPAFHAAVFGSDARHRVIVNIGGIANLTDLPARGAVTGFDTGPGNVLLDLWIHRHLGKDQDDAGAWARSGSVLAAPLAAMLAEPYFAARPPKSCGRELFNAAGCTRVADEVHKMLFVTGVTEGRRRRTGNPRVFAMAVATGLVKDFGAGRNLRSIHWRAVLSFKPIENRRHLGSWQFNWFHGFFFFGELGPAVEAIAAWVF